MATWPISLPPAPLVSGTQYQPLSNATAIPVEAGELLTRRRFTGEMARIPVTLNLTTTQARTLLSFYRVDLGETEPFDWTDPLTGDTVEMVFDGAPQFQALSTDVWQATFALLTKPPLPPGNDEFTKILLHFDGLDGSTGIFDSNLGGSPHTWTAAGNAQIDTSQSQFGGGSLLCDGTGDFVSTPDAADIELGSGDWTMEGRFNVANAGTFASICGKSDVNFTPAGSSSLVRRESTNVLLLLVSNGSANVGVAGTTQFTGAINPGWHHVAAVRTGNILRLFVDGVQEGGDVAFTGSVNNTATDFVVGARTNAGDSPMNGRVDEFRLSVGVARWTANFTPPAKAYGT